MFLYLVLMLIVTAIFVYFGCRLNHKNRVIYLKVLAISLAFAFIFELFNMDFFLLNTFLLENVYDKTGSLFVFFLKWLRFAALLAALITPFFNIR